MLTSRQKKELDEALAELDAMIGLENVKKEIRNLISYAQIVKLREERGLPTRDLNLHMIFSGPPGTGKTEVARKLGRIFRAMGLLSSGHVVEVDRALLVGAYEGQTAKLTQKWVDKAIGGILFIDEAYTLTQRLDAIDGGGGDPYGKESVDTLLKEMEDNRGQLIVIAAGYKDQMEQFVKSNAGLRSRFARVIEFPDYKEDELFSIFESILKSEQYIVEQEAARRIQSHFKTKANRAANSKRQDFGNARYARSFFELILPWQADRLSKVDCDLTALSDEVLSTIMLRDVEAAIEHESDMGRG